MRRALLALVLASSWGLPASAQPTHAAKSPSTATVLSAVIPGGGQIYAGETAKGGLLLVGSGTALATGAVVAKREPYFGCPDPCWEFDTAPLLIGAGVAGALWLYGIVDAAGAARRANRRHGLASLELAPVRIAADGRHRAGVSLRASF